MPIRDNGTYRSSESNYPHRNPDAAFEAEIRKQIHASGSAKRGGGVVALLETQEKQGRWVIDNQDAINAKTRHGIRAA
jgi:hypothetical protein